MREKLPIDGARYQCGFGFNKYEDFRCDNDATEGLHSDDMPTEIPKYVVIYGRALCETHLVFFGK